MKTFFKLAFLILILYFLSFFAYRAFKGAGESPKFIFVILYVVIIFGATVYKYFKRAASENGY